MASKLSLNFLVRRLSALLAVTALSACTATQTSSQAQPVSPLNGCLEEALRRWQTCSLTAYGGVSNIGNPVVQQRLQVCDDRRFQQEDRCMKLHPQR